MYVCREITKLHESVTITSLSDFDAEERGEIVVIVEGKTEEDNPLTDMSIEDHLRHYLDSGMDKKEAVKKVAGERNLPKNDVYQVALTL